MKFKVGDKVRVREFLDKLKMDTYSVGMRKNEEYLEIYRDTYGAVEFLGKLPRMYKHIEFNNGINLSIQASTSHYCTPRITLDDLKGYDTMEIALIGNDFISADELELTDSLKESLNEYYDNTVYGYVPVELIDKLYTELKLVYGLKEKQNEYKINITERNQRFKTLSRLKT